MRRPLTLAALACVGAVAGCHSTTISVQLPPDFHGRVLLNCEGTAKMPAVVAPGGTGTIVCHRPGEAVAVMQNGQPLQPAPKLHWTTAGDGAPISVDFDVP